MPFMKIVKKTKKVKKAVGTIVIIEDEPIRDNVLVDTDGNEYPAENLAPLTPEEEKSCLSVRNIPL